MKYLHYRFFARLFPAPIFPFEFVYMLIYVCVRVCMCNFYLISRLFEQFFHFTNTRDAFNRKTEFNQDLSARPMSPASQRDTQTDGRTAASPKNTHTQQTKLHTNIVFLTLLVQHLVYCWGTRDAWGDNRVRALYSLLSSWVRIHWGYIHE